MDCQLQQLTPILIQNYQRPPYEEIPLNHPLGTQKPTQKPWGSEGTGSEGGQKGLSLMTLVPPDP